MTARVPRQRRAEDRREALVAAATRLAADQGPAACTARAIATQAGLPLASVFYYFPDLSVVVGEAVRRVCDDWRRHARNVADALGPAPDAAKPTEKKQVSVQARRRLATAIAVAVLPPATGDPDGDGPAHRRPLPDRAAVAARYRHLLAAADTHAAAAEMARLRGDLVACIGDILTPIRSGEHVGPVADLMLTVADGAAIGALAEGAPDPAAAVVDALVTAVELLR